MLEWIDNLLDFSSVLNASIAASWMILAVIVLRLLLSKAPKKIHVSLWGLVALRLIMPFSIKSSLSLVPSADTIPEEILRYEGTQLHESAYINIVSNPVFPDNMTLDTGSSVGGLQIDLMLFTFVWLAGAALLLGYAAVSNIMLHRKVREAVILRDNIYQSEKVTTPFILGIIRPRIFIPYDAGNPEIGHVIEHEQTHIRRRDNLWKPIGFCILTIHWFNPLMWAAFILLCRDIELACDEAVIRGLDNEQRADYTQALLNYSVKRSFAIACPLAFGEIGVKERVKKVMNYKKPSFRIVAAAVIAGIILAICFLTDPAGTTSEGRTDGEIIVDKGFVENASTEPASDTFNNIFGYSGYIRSDVMGPFAINYYYGVETDGTEIPIAESYGFEREDYLVDIDGDRIDELLCNCTAGGDGHPDLYVYRLNTKTGTIEVGYFDREKAGLTDWFDWGVNSMLTHYDKDENALIVTYAKGDKKEYEDVSVKFAGESMLKVMTFEEYKPDISDTASGNNADSNLKK